jgi:hypothetical protein
LKIQIYANSFLTDFFSFVKNFTSNFPLHRSEMANATKRTKKYINIVKLWWAAKKFNFLKQWRKIVFHFLFTWWLNFHVVEKYLPGKYLSLSLGLDPTESIDEFFYDINYKEIISKQCSWLFWEFKIYSKNNWEK